MGRPGVGEVEHGGDEGGAKVRVDSAEVGEGVAVGEFEDGEVEIGGGDEVDVCILREFRKGGRGGRWKEVEVFTDRFREG